MLVVEDEPEVAALLTLVLERDGYAVAVVDTVLGVRLGLSASTRQPSCLT